MAAGAMLLMAQSGKIATKDQKAAEAITEAIKALGGEKNINGIRSLILTGKTTFLSNGVEEEIEIRILLPDNILLNPDMVVVGVVDDFLNVSWDETVSMALYRPLEQWFYGSQGGVGEVTFNYIIHPTALSRIGNVERAIMQVDPDAVITRNAAWRDLLGESVRGQTFAMILVIALASLLPVLRRSASNQAERLNWNRINYERR